MLEGIAGGIKNPLEQGKGHGIIGEEDFIERVKSQFVGGRAREREMPAVRRIVARVEPERIIEVVCKVTGVGRGELLRKGRRGYVRGVLMEVLYRHGGLNQREIGGLMGVDYSSVSVGRKRLQGEVGRDQPLRRKIEEIQKSLCQE